MPLPSDYLLALKHDRLSGEAFEELIFFQLIKHGEIGVTMSTCDLVGKARTPITIRFLHYLVLGPKQLSPGRNAENWLIRGFAGYPRFDFMIGYTFIQVSISSFTDHESKESTKISKAFEKLPDFGGKNQIEFYLDETFGPGHAAVIDSTSRAFLLSRGGVTVPEFKIVYVTSQGKPNHTGKVKEYPSILYVSIDELKANLFGELLM